MYNKHTPHSVSSLSNYRNDGRLEFVPEKQYYNMIIITI